MTMTTLLPGIASGLLNLMVGIVLLYLAYQLYRRVTPYNVHEQIVGNNIAHTISMAGYLLGVAIVTVGAFIGPSRGLGTDLFLLVGYTVLGILLLLLSRWANEHWLLHRFSNRKEIVEDRNIGTGAVEFGSYVASALLIAGSVQGEGGGVHTALVFFILGQLSFVVFIRLYDRLVPFDVHAEIEADNVGAGVAFSGMLIAVGIILMKGTSGHFISWEYNLADFGIEVLVGFIALPLVRLLLDKTFIPRLDLDRAIYVKKSIAAGLMEMTLAISVALLVYFTLGAYL